jgi:hypothetical protein
MKFHVGEAVVLIRDSGFAAVKGATAIVKHTRTGAAWTTDAVVSVEWDDTPLRRGQDNGEYYESDFSSAMKPADIDTAYWRDYYNAVTSECP